MSGGGDKKGVLVAGIGNVFLGDDAFGVEAVRELQRRRVPEGVRVMDFGIRSYDLACALTEDYEAVVLVDAAPRGEPPGTVYLLELDPANLKGWEHASVDGHSLEPVRVLQLAQALGGISARLYLAGCEPESAEAAEERMSLSNAVQQAVPAAVEMIEALVQELLRPDRAVQAGAVPE